MKLKRINAILICGAMLVTVLVGCGDKTENTTQDTTPSPPLTDDAETTPTESTEPVVSEEPSPNAAEGNQTSDIDYDAAFAAFPADTIMMNAGGYTVTWDELFFNIRSNINSLIQGFGGIQDWSAVVYDGMTYADMVLDYARENALMYKAVEYGARINNVELSSDVIASIGDDYDSAVAQYGGEDEFQKALWDMDSISSLELFHYLVRTSYLANAVFTALYGDNGERLTDEDAAAYTADEGYLMAKHILRLKTDDEDDTSLAEIEDILAQLDNYKGDDFEAFFDDLMHEYTDDTDGLAMFPNGYLFQNGDMVPEFYDACLALDIGEYSGIVETTYGYHILYRLPINYDEIPSYNYSQYDFTTLRNIAALGLFDSTMYGWMDSLDTVYTDAYNAIDIASIFSQG